MRFDERTHYSSSDDLLAGSGEHRSSRVERKASCWQGEPRSEALKAWLLLRARQGEDGHGLVPRRRCKLVVFRRNAENRLGVVLDRVRILRGKRQGVGRAVS
jgi:hypothetical protein